MTPADVREFMALMGWSTRDLATRLGIAYNTALRLQRRDERDRGVQHRQAMARALAALHHGLEADDVDPKALAAFRAKMEWTVADMAVALDMEPITVVRYLEGSQAPRQPLVLGLAMAAQASALPPWPVTPRRSFQ